MKNLILIMTMCSLVLAKQKATTANGNTVILHDDYTWEFVEEKKKWSTKSYNTSNLSSDIVGTWKVDTDHLISVFKESDEYLNEKPGIGRELMLMLFSAGLELLFSVVTFEFNKDGSVTGLFVEDFFGDYNENTKGTYVKSEWYEKRKKLFINIITKDSLNNLYTEKVQIKIIDSNIIEMGGEMGGDVFKLLKQE